MNPEINICIHLILISFPLIKNKIKNSNIILFPNIWERSEWEKEIEGASPTLTHVTCINKVLSTSEQLNNYREGSVMAKDITSVLSLCT